ncbi:MAG: ComEC/Rec2 family competence protein [Treponema sp.]|jgi:competence protein ComEC|nr:ComEC/Rec2 family competence protein [Treponema sp.]
MRLTLVLCAACGAALAYYSGITFLLVAFGFVVVSLMRTLAYAPIRLRSRYGFRVARVYVIAFAIGLSIGLAAANVARGVKPRLGLSISNNIVGLQGMLRDDPRAFMQGGGMASVALKRVSGAGGLSASASGSVQVFFPATTIPRVKGFGRGAEVYIEGAFQPAKDEAREQTFRAYAVHVIRNAPALERLRTSVRIWLTERFSGFEWGGLAAALLLGVKDELATSLAVAYQDAGCSHILALSGMHLAIIAALIAFVLKRPLGIRPAALACSALILLYVYLVGNLPSLNRAAIMYLLGTLMLLATLPKQGASLLGMSFLIQLILQPEAAHTLSFILSYLALAGIFFISELIYALIRGLLPDFVAKPLAASLGAFIATAAVVAACFGVLRPIGVIAGLVLVPLTTAFMLAAILFLAVSNVAPLLSLLYNALVALSTLAARAPALPATPLPVLLVSTLLVALCVFLYYRQLNTLMTTIRHIQESGLTPQRRAD